MPFTTENTSGENNAKFLHGASKTKLNNIWHRMKQRCHNPNCSDYKYYGARGITVCERWRASFVDFAADLPLRPEGGTLERIDNNRGYEPGNVKWASRLEQGKNTRKVKIIEANGMRMNQSDWARFHGVDSTAIINRIRRGMTPEQAVTEAFRKCA